MNKDYTPFIVGGLFGLAMGIVFEDIIMGISFAILWSVIFNHGPQKKG